MAGYYLPTPFEVAILTIELVRAYDMEYGRNSSRFRITSKTLRRVSNRGRFRDAFLDDWIDALALLGWAVIRIDDDFALIKSDTVAGWTRIASSRIDSLIRSVHDQEPGVLDDIIDELMLQRQDADDR